MLTFLPFGLLQKGEELEGRTRMKVPEFSKLLPGDLRVSHFQGPEKAGVLAKSRGSRLFHCCPGFVEPSSASWAREDAVRAEDKLSLWGTFFS